MDTNNIPNEQSSTKPITEESTALSAQIISAEKNSLLIAIPIGLISGLIAYCTASVFPIMYAFVVGIGAGIITAVLLFHFKFGKHLPKRVIPYTEDSLFPPYEPIRNQGIRDYNLANGNPPVDFIMPKRDY
jgi:hypothetical protein